MRNTIAALKQQIADLKRTCSAQEQAIQILTEQRNQAFAEQANKLVMLRLNSLSPQSGT